MLGLTRHQLTEPHTSGLSDVIVPACLTVVSAKGRLQVPKVADLILNVSQDRIWRLPFNRR